MVAVPGGSFLMGDEHRLRRDALPRLAIEVTGHGTKLAKFALDGQATGPFLDATLTGSHTIQIQMAEQ